MNQITRCPACATMFKVVADQLKVAQGWVRCGQCGEVFEASLHLVPDPMAGLDAAEGSPVQPAPALAQEAGGIQLDALPAALTAAIAATQYPPRIDPTFTGDAYGFKPDSPGAAEAVGLDAAAPEGATPGDQVPEAAAGVSFVRDAQRKAFWRTPQVRVGLGLLFALLLAALALQWVVRQKDVLAAQEPRLASLLQALCRPLGCEIRPLRRIGSVLIDSANFSKTGPDAYRLIFVLKNTGAAVLEIPALEVTLTDSQDQALVRRVLMPAQFAADRVALPARSELAGALSLKVGADGAQAAAASTAGPLPVAGYRLLAFYP